MTRIVPGLCAVFAASMLSACVVVPHGPPRAYYPAPAYDGEIAVAPMPPPAPYAEVIPVAPFLGAVWLSGYWGWSGGRHVWIGGRYDRPRPGYYWQPHRWEPISGRWHLRGGGWARH